MHQQYRYTPTSGDPSSVLQQMSAEGWTVHSYHVTLEPKSQQYSTWTETTHHILWERPGVVPVDAQNDQMVGAV